ncbi:hypothetical protein HMI54_001258 [Coelomomyces lativittatus]|nr:hypothetical protein HMI54_001258 [Coelomomyces lativittatus]KAJ1515260.1 hypothetical protein HMI56_006197 [Coelomomyces lativittatus]KAJ1517240.1 hypothetical protein HMI55_000296 [Coelomomyces lativittatus]
MFFLFVQYPQRRLQHLLRFDSKKQWWLLNIHSSTSDVLCLHPQPLSTKSLPSYDPISIDEKWKHHVPSLHSHLRTPLKPTTLESSDFSMLFPPPNITGHLHCGHALTASIQDALCRYHKIHQKTVRWIPGTDHAGIATQTVVEKNLLKSTGKTKNEIGNEAFLNYSWKWADQQRQHILSQLKQLGFQLNWEDTFFTLDTLRTKIVEEAFCILYQRGLIYRDEKIINWCPKLKTVISNMEVEYVPIPSTMLYPTSEGNIEVGTLHQIAYPLQYPTDIKEIMVYTTRIETIVGDTAIAVHPKDPRYTLLVGKKVIHPLTQKELPIIADERVDMDFGQGALKVTPGHDATDFMIAQSHHLPILHLFDENTKFITVPELACLAGLDRVNVKRKVKELLQQCRAYRGSKPYSMLLPVCSRSKDILEPRLIPQWYLKCSPLAEKVIQLILNKEIQFSDTKSEMELHSWLMSISDWCISRQNGWGHAIPAYFSRKHNQWKVGTNLNLTPDFVKDNDVLDTWFSSALLPLSATNPHRSLFDLSSKPLIDYPTSVIETGSDILFFWVARMALLCTELTGRPPFRKVMLHGLIRDNQGRKMSKSLGNVIDPLQVCHGTSLAAMLENLKKSNLTSEEISKSTSDLSKHFPKGFPAFGIDTLRLTLLAFSSASQIKLDLNKFQYYHRSLNKLWHISNFALAHDIFHCPDLTSSVSLSLPDSWIINRFESTLKQWHDGFNNDLNVARSTQAAMSFLLGNVSDHYLEFIKVTFKYGTTPSNQDSKSVLKFVVQACIYLLHPLVPHITLELQQRLFGTDHIGPPFLPVIERKFKDPTAFDTLQLLIHKARGINGNKDLLTIYTLNHFEPIHAYKLEIQCLTKFKSIQIIDTLEQCPSNAIVVTPHIKLFAHMKSPLSASDKLKTRLTACIEELEKRMTSTKYRENVELSIQQRDSEKLAAFRERLQSVL